jgi:Raf kinase inhibitor-like YbhB/YbcL family protein
MVELMKIRCVEFENEGLIPENFTCLGEDVNPEIIIEKIPAGTKTLAILVEDIDGIKGNFVHWIVFNIFVQKDTKELTIKENSVPGIEGMNDFMTSEYRGPCPPPGFKLHRYYFRVYALDCEFNLSFVTKANLELAMKGHVIGKGEIMGKFKR